MKRYFPKLSSISVSAKLLVLTVLSFLCCLVLALSEPPQLITMITLFSVGVILTLQIVLAMRLSHLTSMVSLSKKILDGEENTKCYQDNFSEIGKVGMLINELSQQNINEQNHLNSLFNYTSDIYLVVNAWGTIVRVNQALEKALGFDEKNLINQNYQTIISEDIDANQLMENSNEDLLLEQSTVLVTMDKQSLPVTYKRIQISHPEAENKEFLFVIQNLSEHRRLISELAKRQNIEKELDRKARENQSLKTLQEESMAIQERLVQSGRSAHMSKVAEGVVCSIGELLDTLKPAATKNKLSRLQKALVLLSQEVQLEVSVETTRVTELIENILTLITDRAKNHNISIKKQFPENAPEITCRPSHLAQAFFELLDNAIDACLLNDSKREIVIEVKKVDGHLEVIFSNSGPHLSPDEVQKSFIPFFTKKGFSQGVGLGLSTSMGIALAHKGQLSFQIRNNLSTFVFILPLKINSTQRSVA